MSGEVRRAISATSCFELFEAFLQLGKAPEYHRRLPPLEVGNSRIAGQKFARAHRLGDDGPAGRDRAFPDAQVAGHTRLTAHHDVVFYDRAAGNPDLRGQQHPLPDRHAVGDLHQVVDLRAGADARLADGGPIDRRVGPDLDVVFDDDVRLLRDLEMTAIGLRRVAEAVGRR